MFDVARELCIVFNGEIYNYRELRASLERGGARFHSHTDTEVLLQLYRRDGERMLGLLRGHVRVRDLGHARAADVRRARSVRHQAALLRRRRRDDPPRLGSQGAARGRRGVARDRSRGRGGLLPHRLRARAVHDPRRRAARRGGDVVLHRRARTRRSADALLDRRGLPPRARRSAASSASPSRRSCSASASRNRSRTISSPTCRWACSSPRASTRPR